MARKLIFLILLHICLDGISAQRSPYSLQAAVDALHRREAQLALKNNYNLPARYGIPPAAAATAQEQDYWDDDSEGGPASSASSHNNNRHRLNRILARYLAREEDNNRNGGGLGTGVRYDFDDDNYLADEKKRSSFFRERDTKEDPPVSLFRERDNQPHDHSELTDQFLKEIEEARDLERQERQKEALRRIWEKYQQQEDELEDEIFEDEKRTVPQPNYYIGPLMQRKRTYPVLPWLPMSRRKRFPVAKRSPKMPYDDLSSKVNAEKVPDELRELFGKTIDDKKKRSADDDQSTEAPVEKKNEKNVTAAPEGQTEHPPHGGHHHKERKHRKRSDHSHESQEEEEDDSEEHEPEHEGHDEEEEDDEHDHDDFDDDEEAQKKKREANDKHMQKRSNLEVVKEDQILPGDLSNFRKKKAVQWSKYFGIDRRKKSSYDSASKKRISQDDDDDEEEKRKKKNIDPERLDNMNKKLQSIEDLIIDETVKYTGAHEGIMDPEEIARLKDHVVSRLATAYSLEKMRRALEKLRQSVDNENHLLRNVVENEPKSDDDSDIENQKRLSVKKEKVEFDGLHHSINGAQNSEKTKAPQGNSMSSDSNNEDDDEDKKRKKQKKRNGYQRYPEIPNDVSEFEEELGAGHYEPLNDAYLGNKNYVPGANQCPLIDSMAERCRGVDLLSGDINQELLPICGVHQICYLCGTSQVACDLQYLAEADSICGHNDDCQSAARSVLMILRGSPGPQLGPKECIKNPCLNRAMREIGL